MPKTCNAENCRYPVWGKGYCKRHQMLREQPVKTKLNRFSKKRSEINRSEYGPAARQYIKDHPECNIKSPVCTGQATCVNHRKGKATIDLLLCQAYWESSCIACNNYIEQFDQWGRDHGHKLNTFI